MRSRLSPALAFTLASLTGAAGSAFAAPLVRDLDGDGSEDKADVDGSGQLAITTKRGTKKVAIGKLMGVTLSSAIVRGAPTIVAQGTNEAVAVQLAGGHWKILVRAAVGPVGLDGEYHDEMVALTEGLYLHQTRDGYTRCDGLPALLFAQGYDGKLFRPMTRLPSRIPETATVIPARRDPDPAPTPLSFKARVASYQAGAKNAGALAIPSELDDGKPDTAWHEELASSAGEGQYFTYRPRVAGAKGPRAAQIRIVTSAQKDANRPQRLGVVARAGSWHIELPPTTAKDPPGTAYVADLPMPIGECVTIVLESTFGPDKGRTEIAELQVFAEGERTGGGEAALAKVVADGGDGVMVASAALATRGPAASAALDAELTKSKNPLARRRLIQAAIRVTDPTIAPILARIALQGEADGADLIEVIKALEKWKSAQELHDLAARPKLPTDARVAASRGLDPHSPRDRALLVALAGNGPRELRQAVIDELSGVPVATLSPEATASAKPSNAGDLWRAITRRAHAEPTERGPALAAMVAALPTATDYERRYRLVDGIAAIGDRAGVQTLVTFLRALPAEDAETAAYKQIAARAIAVNPRPDVDALLGQLTRDHDPGVRLAALSAIASQSGGATQAGAPANVDRMIIAMLSTDTWPEVRRSAAQVLGGRCSRPEPARALGDAVTRDADLNVRGDSLEALVNCKAPGAMQLLGKLWDDSKAPIELRRRAVDLTVVLDDRAFAQKLVGKFTQWRGAAIESEAALALAQNAAIVIGRLALPGAADALVRALDDAAFPEIVAAAATGLGLMGASCPASSKKTLEELAESDEQQVQIAARRAASLCGAR